MSGAGSLRERERRWAMPTYRRAPVEFVRGRGSTLWDREGDEYVDLFSGLSVHNAGHCHPGIVEAVRAQVALSAGSSNLFLSEPVIELHERLGELALGGRSFVCNSGTEANEAAIKVMRRHAHSRGIEQPEIVVVDGGFHGRTLGALSATPKLARPELFGPLLEGFVVVPRDDPGALASAVTERTAGVLLEPIQGESGVHPLPDEVLVAARASSEQAGALLAFDEIQTGMGRTGTLWCYEAGPVRPDLLTTAKALGGGLPVGACVLTPDVGEGLGPGEHGSTFAGGPIGARAALAALAILSDPALLASVRERGEELRSLCAAIDGVEAVRGRGLMLGLALEPGRDAARIAEAALAAGVVVNAPGPATIRLLPPLVIAHDELFRGVERLAEAFAATGRGGA